MEKTIKMIEAHLALWIEMVTTMFVGEVDYFGDVQITREGRTISLKLISETGMKLATNSLTWWAGNSANWIAHDLWIHPELRGTGFIKIIRAWQKRVFKDMCAEHIHCTVKANNPAGLKAAVKAGYKVTGTTGRASDGCVCFHKTTAHHAWINRPNC
tara:strand:+ start:538 stop:1008 length:471 start_codon:yes stop_codon:yes gene_type:complete